MAEFTNEFHVNSVPKNLRTFDVGFDKSYDTQSKFGYKAASQVSRKLSDEMHIPVASLGSKLITSTDVQLPPAVTVTMKIAGLPTDVEVMMKSSGEIKKGDADFGDAARKYLNKQIDVILKKSGFRQDARGFYEESSKDVKPFYTMYEGIHVAAQDHNGDFSLVIDPVTQVRAKLTLLDMLNEELKKREIENWRSAATVEKEINKTFRGKAYNLRSSYVEPQKDEPHHNVYRFVGFKFNKGVGDSSDPRSPGQFHEKFGRSVSPDQPIVEVTAQDGRKVDQVPELLEVLANPRTLKWFGASGKVHDRSLKDANTRFYMTSELLKPLVEAKLIDSAPQQVRVESFGPVLLTLKGSYIDIKSNRDFQEIFKKKKLLIPPSIDSITVFSSKDDSPEARSLVKELLRVFDDFAFSEPKLVEKLDAPSGLQEFYEYVSKEIKSAKPKKTDLVLVVFGFETEDIEEVTYNNLKRESLQQLFPLQFVNKESIQDATEEGKLRTGVANPLFLQIVAKCGGQPYGLQPGFVPGGTVFVAIDKYRQPFKFDSSTVLSVTVFDSEGSYICGNSDFVAYGISSAQEVLARLLNESYSLYKSIKKADASRILFMIDTGPGTMDEELRRYLQNCTDLSNKAKADYVFICGNKGSHLRLYSGDPTDFAMTAERVSPFTAATKMSKENQILVVSTEPIISREHSKEYGTPRAVLYTILAKSGQESIEETKRTVAKSLVWLCRHAWISPASTREPAPIFFANKLSKMVAATGVRITPDRTTAPLFL